jgi:hypothetical protein
VEIGLVVVWVDVVVVTADVTAGLVLCNI